MQLRLTSVGQTTSAGRLSQLDIRLATSLSLYLV
jgi:hypothetical protein